MLVQSSNGTIHLFPAWPLDEPASFRTLRVKGALLISAEWDPIKQLAEGVAVTATIASPVVSLANPFGAHTSKARVLCSNGSSVEVQADPDGKFEWAMRRGDACQVAPSQ
jgi:hypothetical protein|eukprot:COSAG01_NODE_2034_length_8582_cov_36.288459_7_plen_110_part_00